jgi:hypothetical protein
MVGLIGGADDAVEKDSVVGGISSAVEEGVPKPAP